MTRTLEKCRRVAAPLVSEWIGVGVEPTDLDVAWAREDWDDLRASLVRINVKGSDARACILKASRTGDGFLFDEAAGLELVGANARVECFPALYGVDVGAEAILMEDLAGQELERLGRILFNTNEVTATTALEAHQRALATFNACTLGGGGSFARRRARYPASTPTTHLVNQLDTGCAALATSLESLDLTTSHALLRERDAVYDVLVEPGRWSGLTHGDPTPSNVYVIDGVARLFDLETVGVRHIMIDGAFSRLRYLQSVWAQRIPYTIQARAWSAWLSTVDGWLGERAFEAREVEEAHAACALAWLMGMMTRLPRVLESDARWGRSTYGQRLLVAFEHAERIAAPLPAFAAMAQMAGDAHLALARRIPESAASVPTYPVFQIRP